MCNSDPDTPSMSPGNSNDPDFPILNEFTTSPCTYPNQAFDIFIDITPNNIVSSSNWTFNPPPITWNQMGNQVLDIEFAAPGVIDVMVDVTTAASCVYTLSGQIEVLPIPTIVQSLEVCENEEFTIELPMDVTFFNASICNSGDCSNLTPLPPQFGNIFMPDPIASNTTYLISFMNADMCTFEYEIAVTLGTDSAPMPEFPINNMVICEEELDAITSPQYTFDGGTYVYSWYLSDGTLVFSGIPYNPFINMDVNVNIAGVTDFYMTLNDGVGGCESQQYPFSVTVENGPTIPSTTSATSITVCQGATLNNSFDVEWQSYYLHSFLDDVFLIEYSLPQQPLFIDLNTIFDSSIIGTQELSFIAFTDFSICPSETLTITLNVTNGSTDPVDVDLPAQTICVDQSVSAISIDTPDPSQTYEWFNEDPSINPAAIPIFTGTTFNPATDDINFDASMPILYEYWLWSNDGSCTSAITSITVDIEGTPNPPDVEASSISICINDFLDTSFEVDFINGAGGTYNWYFDDNDPALGNPPSVSNPASATIDLNQYFDVSISGMQSLWLEAYFGAISDCAASIVEIVLNVNDGLQNIIVDQTDYTACWLSNSVFDGTYEISDVIVGATINIYDSAPPTGTLLDAIAGTTPVTTIDLNNYFDDSTLGSNSIFIQQELDGCVSTAIEVTVNVIEAPEPPTSSVVWNDNDFCLGEQLPTDWNITTNQPGETVNWYTLNTGTGQFDLISNDNPADLNVLFNPLQVGQNQLFVSIENDMCESTQEILIVDIFEAPTTPALITIPTSICIGESFSDINSSNAFDDHIWYYGDPNIAGSIELVGFTGSVLPANLIPQIDTSVTGTHEIFAAAVNAEGCVSEFSSITLTVNAGTALNITANPTDLTVCANTTILLTGNGGDPANYVWTVGGASTPPGLPNFTVNPVANTTVVLSDFTGNTCIESATYNVNVYPTPVVSFNNSMPAICTGEAALIIADAGPGAIYSWSPPTGLDVTAGSTVNATPPSLPFDYVVSGEDANGCPFSETVTVVASAAADPVAEFTVNETMICLEETFIPVNISQNATGFEWSMPGAIPSSSNDQNVEITYLIEGNYTITLTAFGCNGSNVFSIPVEILAAPFVATSDETICAGETIDLMLDSELDVDTYSWEPSNELINADTPTPTASPTVTTDYILTATHANGCAVQDTITVNVDPFPDFAVQSIGTCANEVVSLSAVSADPSVVFTWTGTNIANPIQANNIEVVPNSAFPTYVVEASSADFTCTVPETINLTLGQLPMIDLTANQSLICQGDEVELTASSFDPIDFNWYLGADTSLLFSGGSVQNITINNPGNNTFLVVVTEAGDEQCVDTAAISIDVNPEPELLVSPETPSICPDDSVLIVASGTGLTYSWDPLTDFIDPNTDAIFDSIIVFPSANTTYTVTSDFNTCINTFEVNVEVTSGLNIQVDASSVLCEGDTITLTPSGATTYSWTDDATFPILNEDNGIITISPDLTTIYTVTGTNASGCEGTLDYFAIVNEAIDITLIPDVSICGSDDYALIESLTGDTNGVLYDWNPTNNLDLTDPSNPIASPTGDIVYSVTVTNDNGCTDMDEVAFTVASAQPFGFNLTDDTICLGQTVTAQINQDFVATIDPLDFSSEGTDNAFFITPDVTTTYTLTGVDQDGCVVDSTFTIVIDDQIDISFINDSPTVCLGDSILLEATGGTNYNWLPEIGLGIPNDNEVWVTPSAPTIYSLLAEDNNGCIDSIAVQVDVQSGGGLTIIADNTTVCSSTEVNFTVTGSTSDYVWTPAIGVNADGSVALDNPTDTTTYYVSSQSAMGCDALDSITINVNPLPAITFSNDSLFLCPNNDAIFTVSGITNNIVWDSPDISPTANPGEFTVSPSFGVGNNIYTVNGLDDNSCENSAALYVEVNDDLTISFVADTDSICAGEALTITVSGANDFVWSPNDGLNVNNEAIVIASPTTTTTYTVDGNSAGCTGSATFTLTVLPLPNLVVLNDSITQVCDGDVVQLEATGADSYIWNPSSILNDNEIPNPIAFPLNDIVVQVEGFNEFGCVANGEVAIDLVTYSVEATAVTDSICLGESVQLNATAGGAVYQWTEAATLDDENIQNPLATPIVTTTYTVFSENDAMCADSSSVTIVVGDSFAPTVSADAAVCEGQSIQLVAQGGTDYNWTPADFLDETDIANPNSTPTSDVEYMVTITNEFGCNETLSVSVAVAPELTLSVLMNQLSGCSDLPFSLNASSQNYDVITWSGGTGSFDNINSLTPTYTPGINESGNVTLTIQAESDACGMIEETVVLDIIDGNLEVDAGPDVIICQGEVIMLNGSTNATTVIWSGGNGNFNTTDNTESIYAPGTNEMGEFYLYLTANNDCGDSTDSLLVQVNPFFDISVSEDQTITEGESVTLLAEGANNYVWTPAIDLSCDDCPNPEASPTETITYLVTDPTVGSCVDEEMVTVFVEPLLDGYLHIPTAFSPNSDGRNDEYRVVHNKVVAFNLKIWNRYGQLVFETDDPDAGWDGYFKNKKQPVSVFVWYCEYSFEYDPLTILNKRGNVTLIH